MKWTNTSFPTDKCRLSDIKRLEKRLDNPEFEDSLGTVYPVLNTHVDLTGVCLKDDVVEVPRVPEEKTEKEGIL